jgi:hypothetical protein
MEFIELKGKEWKMLFNILEIRKPYHCSYCRKIFKLGKIGVFPPVRKSKKNYQLVCGSPLCIIEYLTDLENGKAIDSRRTA